MLAQHPVIWTNIAIKMIAGFSNANIASLQIAADIPIHKAKRKMLG